jgi:hypothetical protein
MGYNISSEDGLFDGYLSYNFSTFSDYWYIRNHLHGHKASTILKYLKIGIQKLRDSGVQSGIQSGQDGWTPEKNVFITHLEYFKSSIEENIKKYPNHANVRYYGDRASGCDETDYSDCISEPDVEENGEDLPVEHEVYTYFRHPIHGNMKINTFAKAAEIHTLLVLKDSSDANWWLEFAKSMPDAPPL